MEVLPLPDSELMRLHRARFVAWSPTAIVALAATGDGTLLAAARESGDIELWETDTWTCTLVRMTQVTPPVCCGACSSCRSAAVQVAAFSLCCCLKGVHKVRSGPAQFTHSP